MTNLKRLHWWMGLVSVVVFLATGVYMLVQFPELYEEEEEIRYLFRANHIYLLMAGLVNGALGLYYVMLPERWRQTAQRLGSVLVLAAPVLLLAAFILEPPQAIPERPVTAAGLFAAALGVFCHVIATLRRTNHTDA